MDASTDLRCSVAVFRNHSVLLVHRTALAGDLRGLGTVQLTRTAPYLGNLWRPGPRDGSRPVVS